ncbi:MAG: gliding motility-associated C-terminal domain-containing protein [Chitinophagaceae bacterium]
MRHLCLSVLLLISMQSAFAQLPVLQWARAFYDKNQWNNSVYSNGRTVGVDPQGNVYSAGLFNYTVDFDPGPGEYLLEAGGRGNTGVYISKLDKDGNFIWAKQVPTLLEFADIELKVDQQGNVYLASNLMNPADMDPGPGVFILTPVGFRDAFVLKLDTDGNFIWAKQFGGPGDTGPESHAVEVDKDNNVIICGMFNNTVDFDPGPAVLNFTSAAHFQEFMVKLSPSGDLIWAKQFGTGKQVYHGSHISDVKTDASGDIFLTGEFSGTCDFDPGAAEYPLTALSLQDGFVARMTPNGDLTWVKRIGDATFQPNNYHMRACAIDIDSKGNIVTGGYFIGTFDFDPGPGVHSVFSNPYDAYVLKLNKQGDFIWAKTFGGSETDYVFDLVVDAADNIYPIGVFGRTVDFDPGPAEYIVNNPNYDAAAVVRLTSEGNFIYAATFPSISYGTTLVKRGIIDKDLNIIITGYFTGTVDADPGTAVYPFNSSSYMNPFLIKLGPCTNKTSATLTVSACSEYIMNNEKFDSSGTFTRTIPNAAGCDSVITLHLTINRKKTTQTKLICEGEAFFAGGADQTTAGTYTDILQSALGCDSIVTTTLIVASNPKPDLGADKNLCTGSVLNVSPGSFSTYQWQDGSTANNFPITTSGTYWVTVSDNAVCKTTDTIKILSVLPLPANFLKNTDSICSYETLTIKPSTSYSSYEWSGGSTLSSISIDKPGTYWLKVVDAAGCAGTDTIIVSPKSCMSGFYIPTAFTPNADGLNDLYKPMLFGLIKKYRFMIYDRWGTVVFQSTDPDKGWDGKTSGTIRGNTVFVWTCTYQLEGANVKTEKGTVTVVQ